MTEDVVQTIATLFTLNLNSRGDAVKLLTEIRELDVPKSTRKLFKKVIRQINSDKKHLGDHKVTFKIIVPKKGKANGKKVKTAKITN